MRRDVPPPTPDAEEPGTAADFATRAAGLVDDLPFIPLKPYEHRWFQLGWRGVLIVCLIIAAFWPSVGGWLWQDDRLLAGDLALRNTWGLKAIWVHAFSSELSPMARTLAWVEFHLPGHDKAVVFRVISLAMHAWTCLFGWFLLRRLGVPAAWLIAAVWAIHPSVLPTVAWPSRQGDLLAAAMSVVAVWAYLASRRIRPYVNDRIWTDPAYHEEEDRDPVWPWVVIALTTIVALPCGSAVPVFAVLGIAAVEWRLLTGRAVALAGALGVTIVARVAFPHGPLPDGGAAVALSARFAEAVAAAPWSVWHAIVPADVPFIYDRWQWESFAWMTALVLATGALLVVPPWVRRGGVTAFAVAAAYAVTHGLTVPHTAGAVTAADLLPYLGGVATTAVILACLARTLNRENFRPIERVARWAGGGVLLVLVGTITVARGPTFADSEATWQKAITLDPDGATAREALAAEFVEQKFIDEAGMQLDRVADRQRGLSWYLARGRVFDAQKRYGEAVGCYETAHRQHPDDVSTTTILAEAYAVAGRPELSVDLYDRLLARTQNDANLYTNAGLARMRLRKMHDAIELYRTALKLEPNHIAAHINLANALFELGEYTQSAEQLHEVIRLDPRNYVAFINSGTMLFLMKQPAKAEQMFQAAVHLNPTSADAYRKLAAALEAQNKDAEATWCWGQAARLESDTEPR